MRTKEERQRDKNLRQARRALQAYGDSFVPQTQEVVVRGGGGMSLLTVLGVVFIVLKLVGTIDWSWWLVLLPLYGPLALLIVGAVIFFIIAGLIALIGAIFNK